LDIQTKHTGISLLSKELFIADDGKAYSNKEIVSSPRIGVDYAGKDAALKYRFFIKDNLYVSGKSK
jgi:DNA-3-methyladenine glycosylase